MKIAELAILTAELTSVALLNHVGACPSLLQSEQWFPMIRQAQHVISSQNVLGEGPLWSGDRLYWCDITPMRLHACKADGSDAKVVQFAERISALGRLAGGRLLVASEKALFSFDPATGERRHLADLETGNATTRSNDGRADRQGGFWIGTMGLAGKPGEGAFYRYYKGEVRLLIPDAHIPNALCFSPDGSTAYLADTPSGKIMKWRLDSAGWPVGELAVHIDFNDNGWRPDGAIVDSAGGLWCAFYGAGIVARFDPDGHETDRVECAATQTTCPAFGGSDLKTIYVTSARQNLSAQVLADQPMAGDIFAFSIDIPGLPEQLVDA